MRVLSALLLASLAIAADLPSGESLIQRSIEREGGAKALKTAARAVITGNVEMVGHNIGGPLAIYQDGEKSYTAIELPGLGKIEEGFDGTVAWESNALQGPRVKNGEELAAVKRSARTSMLEAWKNYYSSARTMGTSDVDGKPAWQVEMTPTEGKPEQFFFDKTSGLLVRISQSLTTAMGEIPVEMTMSDFKLVDGVQTPFLMMQNSMGQSVAMHVDKVTYGAAIPKDRFDLPAQVKALLNKQPAQ